MLLTLGLAALGGAMIAGLTDNLPGIILAYASAVLIISALTYTWTEAFSFLKMAGAAFVLIILIYMTLLIIGFVVPDDELHQKAGLIEGIAMVSVFFVLIPTIIVGIGMGVYRAIKEIRKFEI